jgi:hypothetical protein
MFTGCFAAGQAKTGYGQGQVLLAPLKYTPFFMV